MQTYVYRLYDNRRTVTLDWMMAEAAFVWNHALALQKRYYSLAKSLAWDRSYINAAQMQKHFAKRIARKRLDAQTVQELLQRQDAAFRKFFRHENRRPPKFRKAKEFSSFVFKQTGYKLFGNELVINKVSKRFRFALSRPWDGKVKNVRVLRSRRRWFIAIVTDSPIPSCGKTHTGASAGVDFGLKTFLTLSDGNRIEAPLFYRQLERRIRKCQRLLSKAQPGSNHWKAYKKRLNAVYTELNDKRTDWQYKTAHLLCRQYQTIFIEDLNIAGMARHKHWGKKISDLGWTSFIEKLEYIASKYDVKVHRIQRFYPSSRLCTCGYKNEGLKLSDRSWTCPACGATHNRDLLAANNILRRGIAELESIRKTEDRCAVIG